MSEATFAGSNTIRCDIPKLVESIIIKLTRGGSVSIPNGEAKIVEGKSTRVLVD